MQDVMFLRNRVKEHVELVANHFTNHAVFYCGLYGSQNYGLNTDDSDVDTKCMVLPPFRDVVLGRKMVSTDLADPYGALCNVKDVRAMFDNFFKGNVNFVEVLYTEYFSVGVDYLAEAKELRDHRDMVANRDPLCGSWRWLLVWRGRSMWPSTNTSRAREKCFPSMATIPSSCITLRGSTTS